MTLGGGGGYRENDFRVSLVEDLGNVSDVLQTQKDRTPDTTETTVRDCVWEETNLRKRTQNEHNMYLDDGKNE